MKMEVREIDVEFNSQEDMCVSGVVNKPGEMSEVLYSRGKPFREVIKKGVFQRAIDRAKKIDYLAEHDNKRILASTSNGSLAIKETENGLEMEANIVDTTYGRDAYALIKSGIISHMSFGFKVIKNSWGVCEDGTPLRTIEDLELFEVSSLRNPAYSQSSISARGIEIEDVEVKMVDNTEKRNMNVKFETRDGDKHGNIEIRSKDEKTAEIFFHGYIGNSGWEKCFNDETTVPSDIRNSLEALNNKEIINISINSGGGSVFGGVTIYNLLKKLPAKKIVNVDGLAGSIASVIMMAGDEINVNGAVMVHKPSCECGGNADDFRKMANELDVIQKMIVEIYMTKAKEGIDEKTINKLINKETWMTGEEASKYFDIIVPSVETEEKREEMQEKIENETIPENEVDDTKEDISETEQEDNVNKDEILIDLKALINKIEASKHKIEEEPENE